MLDDLNWSVCSAFTRNRSSYERDVLISTLCSTNFCLNMNLNGILEQILRGNKLFNEIDIFPGNGLDINIFLQKSLLVLYSRRFESKMHKTEKYDI